MSSTIVSGFRKQERIVKRLCSPFLQIPVALGILLGTVYPAQAGLITVTVDIGSEASITFFNPTDNRNVTVSRRDVNRDGKITFGLGTLEREKKIDTVYVCKESDGEKTYGELKLDANGNTLASLEPFNFPSFTGQTTLVASRPRPAAGARPAATRLPSARFSP